MFKPSYFCRDCKWLGTEFAIAFGNFALCPCCKSGDITWTQTYQGVLWDEVG